MRHKGGHEVGIRSAALATVLACALAACSDDAAAPNPPEASASTAPPAAVFSLGDYAYLPLADLIAEYDAARRDQVVTLINAPSASSLRLTMAGVIAGAEPLPDVALFDLASLQAVEASGKYGEPVPLTVYPAAMCFRPDLLAEAGIASTREEFANLLNQNGGGWDQYFAVGRQYTATTGRAWFDGPEVIWQAMAGQLPEGYTVPGRTVSVADDADLRARWDLLGAALADGLSAGERPWDWRTGAALNDGSFATLPCTHATRSSMQQYGDAVGGTPAAWDLADAFPGGGWLMGGDFIAVATDAAEADSAAEFVAWLTAPEQLARIVDMSIGLPANSEAQAAWSETFAGGIFRNAPTGAIDVTRAAAAPPHVVGTGDSAIDVTVAAPILDRITAGEVSVVDGWAEFAAAAG